MIDDLPRVRCALVSSVLTPLKMESPYPGDPGVLEEVRRCLPVTPKRAASLEQILTALDSRAPGVGQPAVVLSDPGQYVRRDNAQSARIGLPTSDPGVDFDRWAAVLQRLAFAVPATTGEPGVSLYHEFKLLSALAHAALLNPDRKADQFVLVSGDFPGVQKTIYTIGSDGATKGVRGRSFFLQLLADCVVRRLLQDVSEALGGALDHLSLTNALYIAGGNFLLLLPAGAAAVVEATTTAINRALLEVFFGDLSLVTASEPISARQITAPDDVRGVLEKVHAAMGRRKMQPLADIALADEAGWKQVFDSQGTGGQFACLISQREPRPGRELAEAQRAERDGQPWVAPEQQAFKQLAIDLARGHFLVFEPVLPGRVKEYHYSEILHRLTGWSCQVVDDLPRGPLATRSCILRLNEIEFNPDSEHGFRLLAAHTPRVRAKDEDWWAKRYPDPDAQLEKGEDQPPKAGDIRNFEMLAYQSPRTAAFARLGVLRMDVDNLGDVFKSRLKPETLTRLIAASDALGLFFDGYLPQMCEKLQAEEGRDESLYLIYGGGDDLFIVGEWDVLPKLAQEIHDEFAQYSNYSLSISAGIVLVPNHFPFYRAADDAKGMLDEAKHRRDAKDSIGFLGEVYGWKSDSVEPEAWAVLTEEQTALKEIAAKIDSDTVSQNVIRIYMTWEKDKDRGEKYIEFGPYLWLAAYQLTRLAGHHEEVSGEITALQKRLLTKKHIGLMGSAARWTVLERRSQGQAED